jgi:hypothetical protein
MRMNPPPELELAACVGLDWADQRHVICLQATGHANTESRQLEQKPDALHDWVAQLRTGFQARPVVPSPRENRQKVFRKPLCDVPEPSERSRHASGTPLESSMLFHEPGHIPLPLALPGEKRL